MKKIPYGIANFEALREADYYFIDKTKYIELLENSDSKYLFFLRPRRFGKSLFISMLEHYYDINRKNQFEELFKDTYIGKNPTQLKNSFPILKLNFSGLPTDGTLKEIENFFNKNIYNSLGLFYSTYPSYTGGDNQFNTDFNNSENASFMLSNFITLMQKKSIKYYLLIDEYDNFANNILAQHGKDVYRDLTHGSGFLRSFFASVKNATETRTVERMFVTGVSPLVLSDVTSGFNMGSNISTDSMFNSMIGFTTEEVIELVDYYIAAGAVKSKEREEILEILKENYDNYCFSNKITEKVYNSDMILYFFIKYFSENSIPRELIDPNVRTDFNKIKFLVVESSRLNGNFNVLTGILEKKEIPVKLTTTFPLEQIIDMEKFKSLLYYFGLLTVKGFTLFGDYVMQIPNQTVSEMYFDYIRDALGRVYDFRIDMSKLSGYIEQAALTDEWEPIFNYALEKYYNETSLRDFKERENSVKMYLLGFLNISNAYNIESEPEMSGGYSDLFFKKNYSLQNNPTKYEAIVELKYIKQDEMQNKEVGKTKLAEYREKAIQQLERYSKSEKITCKLTKIILICSSNKMEYLEIIK